VILLWIVVPVGMVRLGYKQAGAMVVTEGDRAPVYKGPPVDPSVMKPRMENLPKPRVLPDSQFLPKAPTTPKKNPIE
jgi:hypothetical protein